MSNRERILALRQRVISESVTLESLWMEGFSPAEIRQAFTGSHALKLPAMDAPTLMQFFGRDGRADIFKSKAREMRDVRDAAIQFMRRNPSYFIAGLNQEQLRAAIAEGGVLQTVFNVKSDEQARKHFVSLLGGEQAAALRDVIREAGQSNNALLPLLEERIRTAPEVITKPSGDAPVIRMIKPLTKDRILSARMAILEQGLSYGQMRAQGFTGPEMIAAVSGNEQLNVAPMSLSSLSRLYYGGDRNGFMTGSNDHTGENIHHRLNSLAGGMLIKGLKQFVEESDDKTIAASLKEGGSLYPMLGSSYARIDLIKFLPLAQQLRLRTIAEKEAGMFGGVASLRDQLTAHLVSHVQEQIKAGTINREELLKAGFKESDFEAARQGLIEDYLKPKIAAGELTSDMLAAGGFTQEQLDRARSLYLKDAAEEAMRLAGSSDEADRKRAIPYVTEVAIRAARMGASPTEISRFLGEDGVMRSMFTPLSGAEKVSGALRALPTDFMGSRIRNGIKADAYTEVLSRLLGNASLTPASLAETMQAAGFDMSEIQRLPLPTAVDNWLLSSTFLGSSSEVSRIMGNLGYDVHGIWDRAPLVQRIAANLGAADALRLRTLASAHPHIQQVAQRRAIEALSIEAFDPWREDMDPSWKDFPGITEADKAAARMAFMQRKVQMLAGQPSDEARARAATLDAQRALIMGATAEEMKRYVAALPEALRTQTQAAIDLWPHTRALLAVLDKQPLTAETLQHALQSDAFRDLSSYQLAQLPATLLVAGDLRNLFQLASGSSDDRLKAMQTAAREALVREARFRFANASDEALRRSILEGLPPEQIEAMISFASLEDLAGISRNMPPVPTEGEDPYAKWRTMATEGLHLRVAMQLADIADKGPQAVRQLLSGEGELQSIGHAEIAAAMAQMPSEQARALQAQLAAMPVAAGSVQAAVLEDYRKAVAARVEATNTHLAQLREKLMAFEASTHEVRIIESSAMTKIISDARTAGISDRDIGSVIAGLPTTNRIAEAIRQASIDDNIVLRDVMPAGSVLHTLAKNELVRSAVSMVNAASRDEVASLWSEIPFASPADREAARVAYLNEEAARLGKLPFSQEMQHREAITMVQKAVAIGATADEMSRFFVSLPPQLRTVSQQAAADWQRTQALHQLLSRSDVTRENLLTVLAGDATLKGLNVDELRRLPQTLLSPDLLARLADLTRDQTDPRMQAFSLNAEHFLMTEARAALMSGDAQRIAELMKTVLAEDGKLQVAIQGMPLEDVAQLVAHLPPVAETGEDHQEALRLAAYEHLHERITERVVALSTKMPTSAADIQHQMALFSSLRPEDIEAGLKKLTLAQAQRLQMNLAVIPASLRDRIPLAADRYRTLLAERVSTAKTQMTTLSEHVSAFVTTHAAAEKNEINFPLEEVGLKAEALLTAIKAAREAGIDESSIRQLTAGLSADQWKAMGAVAYVGFPVLSGIFPDSYRAGLVAELKEQVAAYVSANKEDEPDAVRRVLSTMDEARWAGVSATQIGAEIAALPSEVKQYLGNVAYVDFPNLAAHLPAPTPKMKLLVAQTRLEQQAKAFAAMTETEGGAVTQRASEMLAAMTAAKELGVPDADIQTMIGKLSLEHQQVLGTMAHAQLPALAGYFPAPSDMAARIAQREQVRQQAAELRTASLKPWKPEQVALYRQAMKDYIDRTLGIAEAARAAQSAPGTINPATGNAWTEQEIKAALDSGKDAAVARQIIDGNLHLTQVISGDQSQSLVNVAMGVYASPELVRVNDPVRMGWSFERLVARDLEQGLGIPALAIGFDKHRPTEQDFPGLSGDDFWTAEHRRTVSDVWDKMVQSYRNQRTQARLAVAADQAMANHPDIREAIRQGNMAELADQAIKKLREARAAGRVTELSTSEQQAVRHIMDRVRLAADAETEGKIPAGIHPSEYLRYAFDLDPELAGLPDERIEVEADQGAAPDGPTLDRARQRAKMPETAIIEDGKIRSGALQEPIMRVRADIDRRLQPIPGLQVADTYRRILADPRVAGIGWTTGVDTPITFRAEVVDRRAQAFLVGVGTPPEKAAEAVQDRPQGGATDIADASSERIKSGQIDARKDKAPDEQEEQRGVA